MKSVFTLKAAPPGGHYSQAVIHNGVVYISGQLPIDPDTRKCVDGTIEEQARQAFRNLNEVLLEAGSGLDFVLKTTVYIPDISLWQKVNDIYSDIFGTNFPARSIVPTSNLHYNCLIEVDAIAALKEDKEE